MRPHRGAVRYVLLLLVLRGYRDGEAAVGAFAPVPLAGAAGAARRGLGHASPRVGGTVQSSASRLAVAASKGGDDDGVIDAVIESGPEEGEGKNRRSDLGERRYEFVRAPREPSRRKRDVVRDAVRKLASLSLEDYKWRSGVFKRDQAERRVEESLARMMGEDPSYVRPMDAGDGRRGPLGEAEKRLVDWLSSVIEEEGRRARKIADGEGDLVRPMDGEGGPLADLERGAVTFVESIRDAEKERWASGAVRPKDVDAARRGPLGDAEARAVSVLEEISAGERRRMEASRSRGGEVVRPIDVPGPLGEVEMKVLEMIEAERQRARDRESNDGRIVRPMDATLTGPLGEAERQATEVFKRLKEEEKERLYNIKRVLEENRPMEANRKSLLGLTEAFTVGLLRGPQLLAKVVVRVKELLQSEKLDKEDEEMLMKLVPSLNQSVAEEIDGNSQKKPSP